MPLQAAASHASSNCYSPLPNPTTHLRHWTGPLRLGLQGFGRQSAFTLQSSSHPAHLPTGLSNSTILATQAPLPATIVVVVHNSIASCQAFCCSSVVTAQISSLTFTSSHTPLTPGVVLRRTLHHTLHPLCIAQHGLGGWASLCQGTRQTAMPYYLYADIC